MVVPGMAFVLALSLVVTDDAFIAGYATAILEREFPGTKASVQVRDGVIYLQAAELKGRDRDRAVSSLSRIDGVRAVRVEEAPAAKPSPGAPEPRPDQEARKTWEAFPDDRLFSPLLADPRWAHFSIGYQHFTRSDFPNLSNAGVVSLGELFNIVAWRPRDAGEFTFGLEPAIFALFNMDALSHDLVNADYRLALPLEYRKGSVALRTSILHQSSHLGDEFLLDTPTQRINLTYEAVDVRASYQAGDFRFYAGASALLHREPSDLDVWSAQQGVEWFSGPGLLGEAVSPLLAVDVQEHQETAWHGNVSVRAGIEFLNPRKTRRRIQVLLEYFRGYNPNGQFYRERADYFGVGLHAYF
jgi:hypothetical protein